MCLLVPTATLLGKGPPKGDENPDFPAFRLASAVLNDLTYGLQAIIRNSGQGYDTSVTHCRATGHVCFFLYRSPNSVEAVRAARKFIDDLVSRNVRLLCRIPFALFAQHSLHRSCSQTLRSRAPSAIG